MGDDTASRDSGLRDERLVQQVDRLVKTGRVTDEEADRVRAAVSRSEIDDAVSQIRLRHIREIIAAGMVQGLITQVEAEALLARVHDGEHPRFLLDLRRKLRAQTKKE